MVDEKSMVFVASTKSDVLIFLVKLGPLKGRNKLVSLCIFRCYEGDALLGDGLSKDESLENASKMSTTPHRLYRNDMKRDEYWAETFVAENTTYHYLPISDEYISSIVTHEATHLSENNLTPFKFMAFMRDFTSELPQIEDFNGEIRHRYAYNIEFFNIKELNNFLNYEWKHLTEASSYVEQTQSFLTPRILASAIVDDLKSRRKEIFVQGSKLINITNKIILKMDKPSNWTEYERLFWALKLKTAELEWEWKKEQVDTSLQKKQNLIFVRALNLMVKSLIIQGIYDGTSKAWEDHKRSPPLTDALNYIDKLSPEEIPNWSHPFQILDFLLKALKERLNISTYHPYPDSHFLFFYLLQLFQKDIYDEILRKYLYGLLTFIMWPIIPDCMYMFPEVTYACQSKEDREERIIISCNQIAKSPLRETTRISSVAHELGRASPAYMKACRRLLVIRNQLSGKCGVSCIGKRDCPVRDKYYLLVKKAWKPLYTDILRLIRTKENQPKEYP